MGILLAIINFDDSSIRTPQIVDILSSTTDNWVRMRIIKTSTLKRFWEAHAETEASLHTWIAQTKAAAWNDIADVRRTIPSADLATVSSGRSVVIFNIAHNRYRLIAAIHFNRAIVYTLTILTHKEYDRNNWKKKL